MAFEELPTPPGYAPIPGVAASDDTSEDTPPTSQARNNVHTIEFITLCFATNVVQNSSVNADLFRGSTKLKFKFPL